MENQIEKNLALSGALLFSVAMALGLWAVVALTGAVKVGIPREALTPHLTGSLGGLWIITVAWTFKFLHYGEKGRRRLAWGVAFPAWANLIVTLFASIVGGRGLWYNGQWANDVVSFLLQVAVVIPTLIACGFWVYGFRTKGQQPAL
jgi:hypothetical protein